MLSPRLELSSLRRLSEMLAIADNELKEKMDAFRRQQAEKVLASTLD